MDNADDNEIELDINQRNFSCIDDKQYEQIQETFIFL